MSKPKKSWIRFILRDDADPKRKTEQWRVIATDGQIILGEIGWYGRWRKYAFFPTSGDDLVFEQDCLRDIADFCERETSNYRNRARRQP